MYEVIATIAKLIHVVKVFLIRNFELFTNRLQHGEIGLMAQGFDGHHYISGLASHFRDLLVSKTKETVELNHNGPLRRRYHNASRSVVWTTTVVSSDQLSSSSHFMVSIIRLFLRI